MLGCSIQYLCSYLSVCFCQDILFEFLIYYYIVKDSQESPQVGEKHNYTEL